MVSIKMHMFAMEKAFRRLISYDCKNVVLPSAPTTTTTKRKEKGKKKKKAAAAQHGAEAAQGEKPPAPGTRSNGCRPAPPNPALPGLPVGRAGLRVELGAELSGLEAPGRPESTGPAG